MIFRVAFSGFMDCKLNELFWIPSKPKKKVFRSRNYPTHKGPSSSSFLRKMAHEKVRESPIFWSVSCELDEWNHILLSWSRSREVEEAGISYLWKYNTKTATALRTWIETTSAQTNSSGTCNRKHVRKKRKTWKITGWLVDCKRGAQKIYVC